MALKPLFGAVFALTILLCACDQTTTQTEQSSPAAAASDSPEAALAQPAPDMLPLPVTAPAARLPSGIAPVHYTLHLDIDPRQERFTGSARIDVRLSGATDFLWLHGQNMAITSAKAKLSTGEELVLGWEQSNDNGVAKLKSSTTLPAGDLSLHFEYNAPFNTSLEGLYKVIKGEDAYAFTQFEATSARLAFPSFDEPAHKVTFDISLTIPEAYTGITNSPEVSAVPGPGGNKTLTFATTKPLPTYLIAFIVGPLDVVEWEPIPANTLRQKALPLRGVTTRGKGDEIKFALQNTAAIVTEMEDYFDTPYPYEKLDIIAVPDFSAGAMENAGAITYREQLILLDENAPVRQQHNFFVTHAHELAHQWFGNLVTPVWWDDIWLNESFATWNSHIILDKLFPEKKYREALQNSASSVMRIDSLASARQIREPIERHEDIGSAFNGITYRKGGGVLSMFESFLGRDNFRQGIRHYMKAFAFGNTTAEDFIDAIAAANPQIPAADLHAAFNSYIEQPGLPVVSSELHCDQNGAEVRLDQQRYLPVGSEGSSDQNWIIPVCLSALNGKSATSQCFLMKQKSETIRLEANNCPDAILPNTGGSGYYRWSLPTEQWLALFESFDDLNSNEQISVANSLSAALNSGNINLSGYFAALPALTTSESWRVAMAPQTDLYKIKDYVANEKQALQLQQDIQRWYLPQFRRLDAIADRAADEDRFRAKAVSILAMGARDVDIRSDLAAAAAAFSGFKGDEKIHPEAVDPNLRLSALMVAVEEFGKPFTDLLWRQFKLEDNALLRQHMLQAIAISTDPVVAELMRERILSPALKDNEIAYIYHSQMAKKENRQQIWEWSQENLWAVMDRIPAWTKGKFPARFDEFCSREEANDIENFFSPIIDSLESGPRYLANTLETIRLCAAFVDVHSQNSPDGGMALVNSGKNP
ncbi:MAG: M1 family aminopeptidase [Halioglobus sp.]